MRYLIKKRSYNGMVINCSVVRIIVLYMCLCTTGKVHKKKDKLYYVITKEGTMQYKTTHCSVIRTQKLHLGPYLVRCVMKDKEKGVLLVFQ